MPKRKKVEKIQKHFPNPFYSNPFTEMVRAFDFYGEPITLNFENKQTHQTFFGGLVTIIFFFGFSSFFIKQMTDWESYYLKD